MTFLNPLVLFGLIAAAIPLILHLLNLRKLRTIEFSTLTFLKELQQTRIRRLKLRQILLLILRTLLVAAIILAFARPALRGRILGTIGTNAHSSVVFILDDSFSMSAADEHGECFKQAKDATVRLIDLLKDGDEAYLIKLSDLPKATIDPATHDFSSLRKMVTESEISSIRRPLDDALRLSSRLLQRSQNANKEIYVLSDMQSTLLRRQAAENTPADLFDEHAKLFAVEFGTRAAINVGFDSVAVKTTIFERDKPVSIHASVRNFNPVPLNGYVVSLFLEGVRCAQRTVSVDAWGSASIELEAIPKHAGFVRGYAELEHDAMEQDDRRYFSFYIPERISVAIIGNAPADYRFVRLALGASGDESNSSLISVRESSVQKFPLLDLKSFDVLALFDLTTLSAGDVEKIEDFVRRGGGLVLFPQATFPKSGGISSPLLTALSIPAVERVAEYPENNATVFRTVDLDHPLFVSMFERDPLKHEQNTQTVESPQIRTSLYRQTGKHGRTVISLADGSTLLSEHDLGGGKILFFSVAPVPEWSDFPLKGIFAPLVHRSIIYTSSRGETIALHRVGDEPTMTVRRATDASDQSQYALVAPDGSQERIQPSEESNSNIGRSTLSFALKRLDQTGFYEIRRDTASLSVFASNVDALESDTRKMTHDEFLNATGRLGIVAQAIQFLQPADQLQEAVVRSRFGVELWRYCIGLALLLALTEMVIARDSRKAMQAAA